MKKYFPKLTQTHVWIELDQSGNGFNCPMLPICKLSEMEEISQNIGKVSELSELAKYQKQMIELIKTVMPAEYHDNLRRLDIPTLSELIAYLMYGDSENDDVEPESKKKQVKTKTKK